MMVIPSDLPAEVAPLAWMLGTWQGWGTLAGADDAPDAPILEEIHAEIVGTHVRVRTTLWNATLRGDELDPMWDASTGMNALESADLIREETAYLRVLPGSGVLPEPGQYEPREFTGSAADLDGYGSLWSGVAMGPRIQMVTDAIARDQRAQNITHMGRMYGLVDGELMWTQERTVDDGDAAIDLSGRLMRTAYATTASGEEIGDMDEPPASPTGSAFVL